MLQLNKVTLLAISGTTNKDDFEQHLKSLLYSKKNINFKKVKLLSPICPIKRNDVQYIKITPLTYTDYSIFVMSKLNNFVDTEFVLIVQSDGFVTNVNKFDPRFLNYDYIGAPWTDAKHYRSVKVGNGGFSLRSKKFLEVSQKYCPLVRFNEDVLVCILFRNIFLKHGIKYAPLELAAKFSYETKDAVKNVTMYDTFGIHGKNEYYHQIVCSEEYNKEK